MKSKNVLKVLSLVVFITIYTSQLFAQTTFLKTITIKNTHSFLVKEKVIEISWNAIQLPNEKIDTSKLIVVDAYSNKQVPYQLETLGTNAIINLLVQVNLKPNENKKLLLRYGTKDFFETKTYGRYVPERKEDFAWENDKIAFRMYGKELEKTPKEMGLGMDVWVKSTQRMILNERYKRGEYHIDHGDGMDYYHVGFTLGAGNMAPYINDSIYYSKNYVAYKVLDNGPLRTTFQLIYDEWMVGDKNVNATKTITLDAGSQLNKITVQYSNYSDTGLTVLAGIVTRKGNGVKYLDAIQGVVTYWEPEHGADGITGVACIVNNPIKNIEEKNSQILIKTSTNKLHTITYYAGAVWNKAGTILSANSWTDYVFQFKQLLEHTLQISVSKK